MPLCAWRETCPVCRRASSATWWRPFVALFILWREGKGISIQRKNLPFHLLRSILGTIGILCNFYAVDHLVLSNASHFE